MLDYFFLTSIFKSETHSVEGLSEGELRYLNNHKRPYCVVYLLLCLGCAILGWQLFLELRNGGEMSEFGNYLGLIGPWVLFHVTFATHIARSCYKSYQLKYDRIIREKARKKVSEKTREKVRENTATMAMPIAETVIADSSELPISKENTSTRAVEETATLADEINERIDNMEFSVPDEALAAINRKKKSRKQGLAGGLVLLIVLGFGVPESLMVSLPAFVGGLMWQSHSYGKDFKTLVVAPLIKSIPGIKADNIAYSSGGVFTGAGIQGELFGLASIAKNDFGLSIDGMGHENQLCVDEENGQTNSCVILRVTSDGETKTEYYYRMLQIINSSLKSEGAILIKRKETKASGFAVRPEDVSINPVRPAKGSGLEEVKLLSPDFVKLFEVYADDQVGARKFLTPAFMEHFMATVRFDFRALHVKSGAITALYDADGDSALKQLGGSFLGRSLPGLFDQGDVLTERLIKQFKKGVKTALTAHYKRVVSLQALLKIKDIEHKG